MSDLDDMTSTQSFFIGSEAQPNSPLPTNAIFLAQALGATQKAVPQAR